MPRQHPILYIGFFFLRVVVFLADLTEQFSQGALLPRFVTSGFEVGLGDAIRLGLPFFDFGLVMVAVVMVVSLFRI